MFNNFKYLSQLYALVCFVFAISTVSSEFDASTKVSRIIGGSPVSIYKVKHQASLRVKSRELLRDFGRGHICGGSVITQRLILTAAHCVEKYVANDLTVVMGNAQRSIPDFQQLQYNVQQVVGHQDFNATTLTNDIALLFINGYIPWDWPTVQAIQLNTQRTAISSVCSISGWGKMANGKMSMNLNEANVPIVSYQQCYNDQVFVPPSMICAGYISLGGVDACQGDSGGPLACDGLLTGIVSWGDGCGLPDRSGVYTNISAFYDWIVQTNRSLNYTFYNGAADSNLSLSLSVLLALTLLYLITFQTLLINMYV